MQRQVLAPAPVIQNIKSRLHTCNARGPKLGTYSDWGLSSILVINKHLSHQRATPNLCPTCKYRIFAGRRESATHVSYRVLEKHICLCFNPSAHPTSCEAAREEEARWSLKACDKLASCRGCSQNRSPLVLQGLHWPCVESMLPAKKKPSGP